MKFQEAIELHVNIRFKMTFWDALKLRMAGDNAQILLKELAKKIKDDCGLL